MKSYAVDIVLLPPTEISQAMIALSDHIYDESDTVHLNAIDRLPHISLLMGVLNEADITLTNSLLATISQKSLPLTLAIEGIISGTSHSMVKIHPSTALLDLQQAIIDSIYPLLKNEVAPEHFYDLPDDKAVEWVKNFSRHNFGQSYNPHITIGPAGKSLTYTGPSAFEAQQLALYQLGRHCTCCKELSQGRHF